MATASLLILTGFLGQNTQYYSRSVYPGYGYYGQTPLTWYDPVRYARYYEGAGMYNYVPPAIEEPEVIVPKQSVMAMPGLTGLVVGMNEKQNSVTLRLPMKTVSVTFGPKTQFRSKDGSFPEIKPGVLVNINQDTSRSCRG